MVTPNNEKKSKNSKQTKRPVSPLNRPKQGGGHSSYNNGQWDQGSGKTGKR